MESSITFNIWALLVGFGAFHGVFLSIVLFSKRENSSSNSYFALLLIVVSYNLLEYTIGISRMYDTFPHILATSYPFLYLMGPLYFFYLLSLFDSDFRITKLHSLHFLPFIISIVLLAPLFFSSVESKMNFLQTLQGKDEVVEIPWGQYLFMATHLIQTFIYVFISKKFLQKKEKEIKSSLSDSSIVNMSLLQKMTSVLTMFLFLFLLVLILLPIIEHYRVEMDYVLMLVMTALIHSIGYIAMKQPAFFSEAIRIIKNEKYATYKLSDIQTENLYSKTVKAIEENQLYLNSDFKISELADLLDLPIHYVSQVINEGAKTNFFNFINSFRIEKAKQLLVKGDSSSSKILAVAFDSGFSNKSTFNRIFKNHTGYTPSQYRDKFL